MGNVLGISEPSSDAFGHSFACVGHCFSHFVFLWDFLDAASAGFETAVEVK